ncbi:ParB/Srx family N-terminal domain-containing protein [Nitrobacter sp. NHB1]|uniref:ParB/Srx family N-terminal domain-containing protein n=1 Tax=Nitrobacter sp. NHB1 TaxID=3119830 RepID=UPI002FFD7E45
MRKRKKIIARSAADILPFQHPAINQVALSDLKLPARKLRTHNRASRRKLAAILRTVGFIDPVVIDENNNVLAGILRCEVAGELGLDTIPAIQISHMNEIEKRAYVLAANRLGEDAGWDQELLAIELGELAIALPEAGIELEATGFSINDFDQIMSDRGDPSPDPVEPELPAPGRPVTRPGDLWLCHRGRLYCADALQPTSYVTLMAGRRATMTFTDPPYNVSIRKHARGLGRRKHREFAIASVNCQTSNSCGFFKPYSGLSPT